MDRGEEDFRDVVYKPQNLIMKLPYPKFGALQFLFHGVSRVNCDSALSDDAPGGLDSLYCRRARGGLVVVGLGGR